MPSLDNTLTIPDPASEKPHPWGRFMVHEVGSNFGKKIPSVFQIVISDLLSLGADMKKPCEYYFSSIKQKT